MKRLRIWGIIVLALFVLVACAPVSGNGNAAPVMETPAAQPTPFENEVPLPDAAIAARQALAEQLQVSPAQIQVREIDQVQWPNACLGAAQPDEMCAEMIVDGFRVVLEVNGETYEFHTNMDGTQMRLLEPAAPQGGKSMPQAAESARDYLAQQLGVDSDAISVISVIPVEWPDSCLGIEDPDTMCAQVITPGYRVVLQANGEQYLFHTDQEGGAVIQAPGIVEITGTVLSWQNTTDGVCRSLEIGPEGISYGPCDGPLTQAENPSARYDELVKMLAAYAPFEAETAAGTVKFTGQGGAEATPAEQRSIAEWANLLYQEVEAGRSGAAWGMALTWHREGGIAGFCDDLFVSQDGWADITSCKPGSAQDMQHVRLTAPELEQLYQWVDQYQSFEYEQKDPAPTDSMTIKLAFEGQGEQQASPTEQEAVAQFASALFARAAR